MLIGNYCLSSDEAARKSVQYPITYTLNEAGSKRNGKALSTVSIEAKKDEKKDPQVEFEGKITKYSFSISWDLEKIRDLKIQLLPTLKDEKFALSLYQELKQQNPEHLPLLLAELKRLNENRKDHFDDILQLSQLIVDIAKPDEVLQYIGARNDESEENLLKKEYVLLNILNSLYLF